MAASLNNQSKQQDQSYQPPKGWKVQISMKERNLASSYCAESGGEGNMVPGKNTHTRGKGRKISNNREACVGREDKIIETLIQKHRKWNRRHKRHEGGM